MICNGQAIPKTTYDTQFNDIWKNTPTEFYNGSTAIYYYGVNDQLILVGPSYNQTNLAKVYFNSSETSKYYEEVYSKNGMKIFKVK